MHAIDQVGMRRKQQQKNVGAGAKKSAVLKNFASCALRIISSDVPRSLIVAYFVLEFYLPFRRLEAQQRNEILSVCIRYLITLKLTLRLEELYRKDCDKAQGHRTR